MPDRIVHAFPFVFAPLLAVVGFAWTAVVGIVSGASERGVALLAQAPSPEASLGAWGGYLLSAGAVLMTLLQSWERGRRERDAEERKAWRQELSDATKALSRAEVRIETLEGQLGEARKIASKAYVASRENKATIDRDVKPAIEAVQAQQGSASNLGLPVTPPETETFPGA